MKSYAVLPVAWSGCLRGGLRGMGENFLFKNIQMATFK
jgi:hypothetical protein